jgi:RNA-directed DNA polymerase
MQQHIRQWNIPRRSGSTIFDLAWEFNPVLRGWINYYGSFYKQELRSVLRHFNHKLLLWAQHKYRKLRSRRMRAHQWLVRAAARMPSLFVHWTVFPADFAPVDGRKVGAV